MTEVAETTIPEKNETRSFEGPFIAPALAASGAAALAVSAGLAAAFPLTEEADAASVSLARYLDNDFCFAILTLGIWGLIYGALQIYGSVLEHRMIETGSDASRFMRRLTSAVTRSALLAGEGVQEPALRASIAADRFDAHRTLKMAPISYVIWALPLMGFIGTVIGISGAIGGLGGVFADAGREEALTGVLSHLRYAFDTTFVGLAMVIPSMALSTIYNTRSDATRHVLVTRAIKS